MNSERVSVILPVYNGSQTLRAAILSAMSQVDVEVQIIAVDDGSTCTETTRILDSFRNTVTVIRQANAGPAAARNLAVQHASHEWIAFLDQDDLWEPEKLSVQLRIAKQQNADVVYTNARNFGELQRVGTLRNHPDQMPSGHVFKALIMDNFMTMAGVMMKRSLFLKEGGFRPEFSGVDDWDLWLRVSAAGAVFAAVPEPLTLYRWHSGSLSKRHHEMKSLREQVLYQAIQSPAGRKLPWSLRRRAIANIRSTSAWFIAEQEPVQAAIWYAQSLVWWPFARTSWKGLVKSCLRRP